MSENEDGKVRVIDGTFTSVKVLTSADAVRVINSVAATLGAVQGFATSGLIDTQDLVIPASGSQGETTTHFYRLTQAVDGVPVLGTQIILSTDADGTVTGLFSTYDTGLQSVDTRPDSTVDEAIAVVKSAIVSKIDDAPDQAAIEAFLSTLTFQARTMIYDVDYDVAPDWPGR